MTVTIRKGDCREVLRTLTDESVHCVVTSPPYWGLRDYGTATWQGGDEHCEHEARRIRRDAGSQPNINGNAGKVIRDGANSVKWECECGSRRIDSQIGLESDFNAYVSEMVKMFREVRRVLRKDGTLWLNLGDSYASSINGRKAADILDDDRAFRDKPFSTVVPGLFKPKDLCGIPWRVAFALQADGWWLRQDIIWSKPNPMPESVTDRCTKAHEYLFLLSKSERYYYDQEAIKEPGSDNSHGGPEVRPGWKNESSGRRDAGTLGKWTTEDKSNGRNKRSVWEIATAPFSEAHFATFPPALIEPCIKAGTSERGCCAKCGAPVLRNIERENNGGWSEKYSDEQNEWQPRHGGIRGKRVDGADRPARVLSEAWSPSCSCNAAAVPCTVLDPFGGAGTTGLVADRLGRNAILIELNHEYAAMAERRIVNDAGLFAQVAAE